MKPALMLITALFALAPVAHAEPDLERGFAGALKGCEAWTLHPENWIEGTSPFRKTVGLGGKMKEVGSIDEVSQPPAQLRQGNHYWRIDATPSAGFMLVVSDILPMCHITGGGDTDLQPVVEAVLASPEFADRWDKMSEDGLDEMSTSVYRNREVPDFSIVISRAGKPGQRTDRVQVMATATLQLKPQ